MKIQNDQFVFDDSDVQSLSPLVQKALTLKGIQTNISPSELLSGAFGDCIQNALDLFKTTKATDNKDILDALATVDDATANAVRVQLGVAVKPVAPDAGATADANTPISA